MADTIRWGIIGAGEVAEVKSGPAFQKAEGSELVAVMRRDAAKAQDFAKRHGVPHWFADAGELIAHPEVNAVYVATPPSSHEDYAIQALEAGKDVYLEKPMAPDVAACQRILEAVRRTGQKLSMAHYRRALPGFVKVKELLDAGALGDLRLVQLQVMQRANPGLAGGSWRVQPDISGGGLFHDLAPHHLDLLHCFFGEAREIQGFAANQAKLYPAADMVSAQMVFGEALLARGLWSFNTPASACREVCEIIGSNGMLSFNFSGQEIRLHGETEQTWTFENPPNIQLPMIERVNRYFRGEGGNPCSAEEGCRIMEWIEQISSRHG